MVKLIEKTCMIVLVVLGSTPYVYCQEAAVGSDEDAGVVSPAAGTRGSGSGEAGEEQAETLRDPFWPVGYEPSKSEDFLGVTDPERVDDETGPASHDELDMTGLSDEEQAIIKSRVKVGGILVQKNECIAIINSQLVRQGDDLSVLTEMKHYKFMIRKLTPDRIVLDSVNEPVRVGGQNP